MTQHLLEQDTLEDKQTMRRLFTVIGIFIAATAVLAVAVGITMG